MTQAGVASIGTEPSQVHEIYGYKRPVYCVFPIGIKFASFETGGNVFRTTGSENIEPLAFWATRESDRACLAGFLPGKRFFYLGTFCFWRQSEH
ncbi:MAG TPA: hypothetical protein DIS96_14710 [Pusillimonas sp.]|nr:hypothetical protein [Pusillimonas sp.]